MYCLIRNVFVGIVDCGCDRFEFLPLMLMSVVCAGGLVVYWIRLYHLHQRLLKALSQYTCDLKKVLTPRRTTSSLSSSSSRRFRFATDTE